VGSFTFDPGPSSETTFTISATAPNGLAATKTLTIQTTDQPLLDNFTVSPQTVGSGDDVTVSWVVLNATTVTINGNPAASAGTQTLPVTELTSFILDASNANGSLQETRFGVISPPGEPVLTEFLASNIDGLLDEESDDSDWIQISNPTQLDVVIDGSYYLTDDPLDLTKWQIPAQTITPGNSIVIFSSGKKFTDSRQLQPQDRRRIPRPRQSRWRQHYPHGIQRLPAAIQQSLLRSRGGLFHAALLQSSHSRLGEFRRVVQRLREGHLFLN
jgi:archaellum component FlaG (FlaF/FlaG flagellin family)